MNFFGKLYFFKDWYGRTHFWTAKKLYNRVMTDANASNYNWIASATELVRVCTRTDFPKHYANEIKVAILECFTRSENEDRWRSEREPTADDAVHYCYNTLTGTDEAIINAKKEYFNAIIRNSSLTPHYTHSFYINGATYLKLREEWRNKKLSEFDSEKIVNFEQLMKELQMDFSQTIKIAEDRGAFKEDDEKWHQKIKEMFASILKERCQMNF